MQPTLETDRLVLRPFTASDAERVQVLAGEYAIADTTLNIPHPYEEGMAEAWISTHAAKYAAEELAAFAVTLKDGDRSPVSARGTWILDRRSLLESGVLHRGQQSSCGFWIFCAWAS
jgi:RimJ/RimL family protein N-acetyltransferase